MNKNQVPARVHDLLEKGRLFDAAVALLDTDLKETLGGNKTDTQDQVEDYLVGLAQRVKDNVDAWEE